MRIKWLSSNPDDKYIFISNSKYYLTQNVFKIFLKDYFKNMVNKN